MKISDVYLQKIEEKLREYGAEVVHWGEPNASGYLRPTLKDDNDKRISVKPLSDSVICISEFGDRYLDKNIYFNITSSSYVNDSKEIAKLNKEYNKAREEANKENFKKFVDKFENLTESKTPCKILDMKKIRIPKDSPAFTAVEVPITDSYSLKNALVVPFVTELDGKVKGAQARDDSSKKYSLLGSTLTGAFHVLQTGKPIDAVNLVPTYLAESFTTACEVAEAAPEFAVICTAGINQLIPVYDKLTRELPDHLFIMVLDKTKNNKYNKQLNDLENTIREKKIPYIQLDKQSSDQLHLTDFNDYALEHGKTEVKKKINIQSVRFLPYKPEVLSMTEKGFMVVSATTQLPVEVSRGTLVSQLPMIANSHYVDFVCRLYGVKKSNKKALKEFFVDAFEQEALSSQSNLVKGLGIFKDKTSYIANLKGGRFQATKDSFKFINEFKPDKKNTYVRVPFEKELPDLVQESFSLETLKKLKNIWSETYNLDTSILVALMGFVAQAAYASFSRHRAHVWITGTTASGKTFLLNNFIKNLARGFVHSSENATAAGISQRISPDDGSQNSPLITIDEAGNDTPSKALRVEELIALAREMATNDGDTVSVRGTKDQTGKVFRRNCSMIFSSTTHSLSDPQDIARMLILDFTKALRMTDNSNYVFGRVSKELEALSPAFVQGVIKGAPYFTAFFDQVSQKLYEEKSLINAIRGHKIAALIAVISGACALFKAARPEKSDEDILTSVFKELKHFFETQKEAQVEMMENADSLIESILSMKVKFEGSYMRLIHLLENETINKEMYSDYRIRLTECGTRLVINISKYKLNKLTNSRNQVMDPFHCDKGVLLEQVKLLGDRVKLWTKQCPETKKVNRFISIAVPKGERNVE